MATKSSCSDSHCTIATEQKATHRETSLLPILENANVRATGSQSFQTLGNNALFLYSEVLKAAMDENRCQGKSKGFVLAASMFQSNQPKVPCYTHICQEKGLDVFIIPSQSTVVILQYSGSFSFFFSLIFIINFNEQSLFLRQEKKHFFSVNN